MISALASKRVLTMARAPSATRCLVAVRAFTIGDDLHSKEHFEETRFIREQEKAFFEKKKKELDEKKHAQELAIFEESIAPAMAEVESLLKKTNDTVSHDGLEALARWKLGM